MNLVYANSTRHERLFAGDPMNSVAGSEKTPTRLPENSK